MPVPMRAVLEINGDEIRLTAEQLDRVREALEGVVRAGRSTLVDLSPRVGQLYVLIGPGIPTTLRLVPEEVAGPKVW